ncbi:NifU family protein [Fulvivirga sediminis]|uniref:NifU family protein n=1 Tax=Fulvivirga sediminis TaxID=2803949 RepID=A0A937JXL1_9BACT|nr:NifU family protein [Fulvivirga sediminis]MBL3655583.1 NifU family protein [Fulvivirga sediminis]
METANSLTMDEIKEQIDTALDNIRPYLKTDGGNVKLLDVSDDLVVTLELLGACGSCPMSTMTLKAGVEEAIRKVVPQVKSVEAVNITRPDDPNAKLPDNLA